MYEYRSGDVPIICNVMYDDSARRSSKEMRDTPDETRLYSRKQAAFASEEDKSDKDRGRVDKGTGVEHCII